MASAHCPRKNVLTIVGSQFSTQACYSISVEILYVVLRLDSSFVIGWTPLLYCGMRSPVVHKLDSSACLWARLLTCHRLDSSACLWTRLLTCHRLESSACLWTRLLTCHRLDSSACLCTVKVRLLESIFTRYMALFKVPWCLALETSLKRPRQDTCLS
jgi:hypothetical protein